MIEKRAGVGQRTSDQLIGMREVDRLDPERARWWQHDELHAITVQLVRAWSAMPSALDGGCSSAQA
jgi:hypothetical protein